MASFDRLAILLMLRLARVRYVYAYLTGDETRTRYVRGMFVAGLVLIGVSAAQAARQEGLAIGLGCLLVHAWLLGPRCYTFLRVAVSLDKGSTMPSAVVLSALAYVEVMLVVVVVITSLALPPWSVLSADRFVPLLAGVGATGAGVSAAVDEGKPRRRLEKDVRRLALRLTPVRPRVGG